MKESVLSSQNHEEKLHRICSTETVMRLYNITQGYIIFTNLIVKNF